jgi:hypothetical protein
MSLTTFIVVNAVLDSLVAAGLLALLQRPIRRDSRAAARLVEAPAVREQLRRAA